MSESILVSAVRFLGLVLLVIGAGFFMILCLGLNDLSLLDDLSALNFLVFCLLEAGPNKPMLFVCLRLGRSSLVDLSLLDDLSAIDKLLASCVWEAGRFLLFNCARLDLSLLGDLSVLDNLSLLGDLPALDNLATFCLFEAGPSRRLLLVLERLDLSELVDLLLLGDLSTPDNFPAVLFSDEVLARS